MKIGVFTDLHLNNWKSFGLSSEGIISRRLQDQVNVCDQIIDIFRSQGVELILNGGDTFHLRGSIPVEVINVARDFFTRLNEIGLVMNCRGNHDMISDTVYSKFYDAVNFLDYQNRVYAKQSTFSDKSSKSIKIQLVDYCDVLDENSIVGNDIVLLHKQPDLINRHGFHLEGCNWRTLCNNNKWVLFGHYHEPQKLAENCHILGTPMQLEFGDEIKRGIYVLDTTKNVLDFFALEYPKFLTVDSEKEVVDDHNYYRVMHSEKRIDKDNVVTVITPEFFEERIKALDFDSSLREWLSIKQKDISYLDPIKDILDEKISEAKVFFRGRIDKVEVENFMSIGRAELRFDNGFILITGMNESGGSNGSGKSSLIDSILWGLFGDSSKGLTGNDVVRRGCKDCNVTIKLNDIDGRIVTVNRSRKEGLSISIQEQGDFKIITDGMKENVKQDILEKQILGFDKKIFMTSCYFSQESLNMFSNLSNSEQTNMIAHLLGFDIYDDLKLNCGSKIARKTSEKIDFEREIVNKNNDIEIQKRLIAEKEGYLKEIFLSIGEHSKQISTIEQNIQNNNKEIITLRNQLSESHSAKNHEEELSKNSDRIRDIKKELCELDQTKSQNSAKLVTKTSEFNVGMNNVKILNREIIDIEKNKKMLESLEFGQRCDKCGSLISEENVGSFIVEMQTNVESRAASVNAIHESCNKISEEIHVIKECERNTALKTKELNAERDLLERKNIELMAEQNSCKLEIDKINNNINSIEKINDAHVKSIKDYELMKEKQKNRFELVREEKKNCELQIIKIQENIDATQKEIDILKNEIEIVEFWSEAFSHKGIRSLLLDKFCNEFNVIVNNYLSTVSNGNMSITISPTKTLKSGEDRNKIGMTIFFSGNNVKYETLSGGEKRRVDVALCLGLNKWIANRNGLKIGLLGTIIFDELFSFIDRLGEETIGTLLYHEGENKTIFVVSHTPELNSFAKRQILVKKINAVSSLEYQGGY